MLDEVVDVGAGHPCALHCLGQTSYKLMRWFIPGSRLWLLVVVSVDELVDELVDGLVDELLGKLLENVNGYRNLQDFCTNSGTISRFIKRFMGEINLNLKLRIFLAINAVTLLTLYPTT